MAQARRELEWAQTSEILAMVYNMHRASDARPVKAEQLNPTARPSPEPDEDDFVERVTREWVAWGKTKETGHG